MEPLHSAFSGRELLSLSSIVHVGDAAYSELVADGSPVFSHPYFSDIRGRIRTKLVQMQCEIESREPNFPFEFLQQYFPYGQCVPELRTKNMILHIGRSSAPDALPYEAKYKLRLSHNNKPICRQLVIDMDNTPPTGFEPFYGLLVFGGRRETFAVVQFPEPGFYGIADSISIPRILETANSDKETFERRKAGLKQEFLSHGLEEVVSGG